MFDLSDFKKYSRITQGDFDILSTVPYGVYVEVGTCHGASACAVTLSKATSITTIDIYDHQPKIYEAVLSDLAERIEFFKGTSEDYAKYLTTKYSGPSIDTLFIDGAHEFEYVLKDCHALVPHVKKGGTVLFRDHNPNNPITRVYEAINYFLESVPHKAFPKVEGTSNLLHIELL